METPALDQLMMAYFHEDWDADGSEDDVVRLFLVDEPGLASQLPREVDILLEQVREESETAAYIESRQPAYDPCAKYGSYRAWLIAIADRARG